jgi:hypothetical protein
VTEADRIPVRFSRRLGSYLQTGDSDPVLNMDQIELIKHCLGKRGSKVAVVHTSSPSLARTAAGRRQRIGAAQQVVEADPGTAGL